MKKKDPNKYPKGWNAAKVRAIIDHYDNQTEEEAIAEDDAAWANSKYCAVPVPNELVGEVNKLIAQHEARNARKRSTTRKKTARAAERTAPSTKGRQKVNRK